MRVLVTGAGGLLGGRLASLLAETFHVVAGFRETPPPEGLEAVRLDLLGDVSTQLDDCRPQAVVHAAAIADPDHCEAQPLLAERVNVHAADAVARWCASRGIYLIAISTDLVFRGDRPPYREDDPPDPILVYGQTKLEGERVVRAAHPHSAVIRVSLVVGQGHGPRTTATETIASALLGRRPLRLYTDQFRTPVDDRSVADALSRLLARRTEGLFHLGGKDRVSRFGLGERVARALSLDSRFLEPTTMVGFPPKAPRPVDVSLDSSHAGTLLGWSPRNLHSAIIETRTTTDEPS